MIQATEHRVTIEADLLATEHGGLKARLEDGNRSLLFVFPASEEVDGVVRLGAMVDEIEGGEPGGHLTARLTFWSDLADLYATPEAGFEIWYGRIVGRGTVSGPRSREPSWGD